jgi:hypothetical protein
MQPSGAVRMKVIRIGLDTSKHVFQIHGLTRTNRGVAAWRGREILSQRQRRREYVSRRAALRTIGRGPARPRALKGLSRNDSLTCSASERSNAPNRSTEAVRITGSCAIQFSARGASDRGGDESGGLLGIRPTRDVNPFAGFQVFVVTEEMGNLVAEDGRQILV